MKRWGTIIALVIALWPWQHAGAASGKTRFFIVSSYNREYLWSQDTSQGLVAAMLKFGYLDDQSQADEYTKHDYVESSKAVLKKAWMDTKRHSGEEEMKATAAEIVQAVKEFQPNVILLGDDNAANYIGNAFLDTDTPVVFWGVNNTPIKYGLLDSAEHPGHNITGVYQLGYYVESLELLKRLAPGVKRFATLADASETGRAFAKAIDLLAREGKLPVELADTVSTNEFEVFQKRTLELQDKVDAFFVAPWASMKGPQGQSVSPEDVAEWYLEHVKRPEATGNKQYVQYGLLCTVDDSGYKQAFEAVTMAHNILANGMQPSMYHPVVPTRGNIVVNRQRAQMLGLTPTSEMGIEEYIDNTGTLKDDAK